MTTEDFLENPRNTPEGHTAPDDPQVCPIGATPYDASLALETLKIISALIVCSDPLPPIRWLYLTKKYIFLQSMVGTAA
jgi:hypothetical protein